MEVALPVAICAKDQYLKVDEILSHSNVWLKLASIAALILRAQRTNYQ